MNGLYRVINALIGGPLAIILAYLLNDGDNVMILFYFITYLYIAGGKDEE